MKEAKTRNGMRHALWMTALGKPMAAIIGRGMKESNQGIQDGLSFI